MTGAMQVRRPARVVIAGAALVLGMSSLKALTSFCFCRGFPASLRLRVVARRAEDNYVGRFEGTQKGDTGVSEAEEARAAAGSRGKTSTKWSILSERMEGLARELYMVTNSLDPYIKDMSDAEGPAMLAIREKMESTDWSGLWDRKETMFSYGGEMSTDPVEAMFLKMLTYMKSPSSVLEIGMFAGYGSMAIAEALPAGGKITSLDIDPFLKDWVQDVTKSRPEGEKHVIIVGPALDSLKQEDFPDKFDLVFVDANKAEYKDYVTTLLERDLLAPNAMIVADNVLYNGYPYLSEMYDAQPSRRGYGDAVKEFNLWVKNNPKLEQVILPIRDGVSFIRVRS